MRLLLRKNASGGRRKGAAAEALTSMRPVKEASTSSQSVVEFETPGVCGGGGGGSVAVVGLKNLGKVNKSNRRSENESESESESGLVRDHLEAHLSSKFFISL